MHISGSVLVDATQQTDQRTSRMVYLFFAEALNLSAKNVNLFLREPLGLAQPNPDVNSGNLFLSKPQASPLKLWKEWKPWNQRKKGLCTSAVWLQWPGFFYRYYFADWRGFSKVNEDQNFNRRNTLLFRGLKFLSDLSACGLRTGRRRDCAGKRVCETPKRPFMDGH